MDIIFDVIILFADKIVDSFDSLRNFSKQLNEVAPVTKATMSWLKKNFETQLNRTNSSPKNLVDSLLISVCVNKRSKYRILIRGLMKNGKRAFEVTGLYDEGSIPNEFKHLPINKIHYFRANCNEYSNY